MQSAHDPNEPLPRVTAALLRGAEVMCARRLDQEHRGARGNRRSTRRFRVLNQIVEDARSNHRDRRLPDLGFFSGSDDLLAEEQRVYENAAAWYVTLFAKRPVRGVDVDFETEHPATGVRLVGPAGLAVEADDGTHELRVLRLGGAPLPADPFDATDVRFAHRRMAEWLDHDRVRVVLADLAHGEVSVTESTGGARGRGLDAWLGERVALIRTRTAEPAPSAGVECGWCPFVAGCPAHRAS